MMFRLEHYFFAAKRSFFSFSLLWFSLVCIFKNFPLLAANFFALPVEEVTNLPLALIAVEIPE